ncbi:hypothetical protein FOL47_008013 [Perkinsus chesapeaki]|uniref:Alternative oxidase, mitochondrial n=1 Tax=Perkinsus chesapeaki TaxID=330153 RepID=A0A7J6LGD2_PERCH|nr:hypothetical protein FOL47_008013 [Perkinsus chesapeaki]
MLLRSAVFLPAATCSLKRQAIWHLSRSVSSATEAKAREFQQSAADLIHFHSNSPALGATPEPEPHSAHALPHPIWDMSLVDDVELTHYPPKTFADKAAHFSVRSLRSVFDLLSGYRFGRRSAKLWIRRVVFLETVAGVPGMVGAMNRHLRSLRKMERDFGWIHTLLEEAENERMHLMIALSLMKPGPLLRALVLGAQGAFFTFYGLAYAVSPHYAHRFVGYLEEEAVLTYTCLLQSVDKGEIPEFTSLRAPFVAQDYYQLPSSATLRDVFACMRADESHHRDVNHTFAMMDKSEPNPFPPGH